MPTTTFTARASRQGEAVYLTVTDSAGRQFSRSLELTEVDTPEKLATWVLAQATTGRADVPAFRKTYTVTWHTGEVGTGLDGQPLTGRIIDSVAASDTAETTGLADLLASPLATVTLAEANAAVDAIEGIPNTAKVYLKRLNTLVLAERDILRRVVDIMRQAGVG